VMSVRHLVIGLEMRQRGVRGRIGQAAQPRE
jgi:hypothetical protein